ncbi:hypothetical protein [Escherichia coli]|uniref:hypothetical protein n=1 Tax=Escherichia coli TaxID=562 RepID=UPI003EBDDBB7
MWITIAPFVTTEKVSQTTLEIIPKGSVTICAGHGAMGQWQCVMVALTGFEPATKRL